MKVSIFMIFGSMEKDRREKIVQFGIDIQYYKNI